jgi:hypothetical protein
MDNILGMVTGLMKGDTLGTLSQLIGSDSDGATKKAITAGASALISNLAGRAATPDGAMALSQMLPQVDSNIVDNVPGYLSNPSSVNGLGMLQQFLGSDMGAVENKVAKMSGLSQGAVGRLLPILTPLVLGGISNMMRSQGLGAQDLPKFLSDQQGYMRTLSPGIMGFLERIDANDDGSILDDLGRLADNLFGKR